MCFFFLHTHKSYRHFVRLRDELRTRSIGRQIGLSTVVQTYNIFVVSRKVTGLAKGRKSSYLLPRRHVKRRPRAVVDDYNITQRLPVMIIRRRAELRDAGEKIARAKPSWIMKKKKKRYKYDYGA